MKYILTIYTLCILSLSACASTPDSIDMEYHSNGALVNGTEISVTINTANVDHSFIYDEPIWWGAELVTPKTITKHVSVTVGSNSSWVRFSSYSDLVNINTTELKVSKNGFQIIIDGGESATHYIASINFDNEGFLVSRKVYSPTFPDEVWEETKYSFIRRNDM